MDDIQLNLDANGQGAFTIEKDHERIAEMVISISGKELTVHHTGVLEELRGQGIASKLMEAMVKYARENQLKVIIFCPYVSAQFKKHPQQYADIWKNSRI